MPIRTFDTNINYKKAKLSRELPLKQKISRGVTALFLSASAMAFVVAPFIETPITGYTFDGHNLESAERVGDTYNLDYKDNAHYELSFDELQKQYNEDKRYYADLDNSHKASITPVVDKSTQNKVLSVGMFSLIIGAGPTMIKIEKNKKSKPTQRR